MDQLTRAVGIIVEEFDHERDLTEAIRKGVQNAVELGVIVIAQCHCPVGFGQVRDPRCPTHGNRGPRHTITGAQQKMEAGPSSAGLADAG